LLLVAVIMGVLLAPIAWQGIREQRRREATRQNLQQIRKAVEAYEKTHPNESEGDSKSSLP
jgi:type II secretory pathway pseudopilin PulG